MIPNKKNANLKSSLDNIDIILEGEKGNFPRSQKSFCEETSQVSILLGNLLFTSLSLPLIRCLAPAFCQ